ncbi:NAD(+) synthase [Elizabethkingia argentiflava]|uniref:NH(3)-dependent NAD(+) synthetase n=1 Tax=Elizabethkingia argenteiflava TaxID=2681556 RepID=A0A845PT72_9FLAO|nr:NAD(+) synthase [Elizabethkingia argenteiflava]NAW51432.1 NAD(+) synthase [Elizabethkingia argenteiflava]
MQSEKIIEHIVTWLKAYAEKSGMKGFVVGVSGGIDSAVVSTLAAMTGMKTLVLEMPIRQKEDQVNRAQEHIAFLKNKYAQVEGLRIDLTPTFETFQSQVDAEKKDFPNKQLALANSRSRLRMVTLYYYGQLHQLLVTGTGNKIEDFGVGFFTKYGDGGVDISPIADLLKTEVYKIAKYLNIAESIQKAIPTDGLWDVEKNDEQQMGASYPELEWAMEVYENHSAEDFSGRKKEVFQLYDRLHQATLHKVNPIPVCKIPQELKN